MEQFFIIVVVPIVLLILGYLFMKQYNKIDRRFFGQTQRYVPAMKNGSVAPIKSIAENNPDYKPFGRVQVLASAVLGGMLTGIPIIDEFVRIDDETYLLVVVLTLLTVLSYNLYEAIARMPTAGKRIGKFVFLTVACIIGAGFGALGSLVIFAGIVFYIIFLVFRMILGGPLLKKGEILLDDGTVVKNRKGLFGEDNYTDNDGSVWNRSGDTFTKE